MDDRAIAVFERMTAVRVHVYQMASLKWPWGQLHEQVAIDTNKPEPDEEAYLLLTSRLLESQVRFIRVQMKTSTT